MNTTLSECFVKHGKQITIEKNQAIYAPDNKVQADTIYYLESGIVALMSYSKDGEERVYQYFNGGRIVGFMPLLMQAADAYAIFEKPIYNQMFLVTKTRSVFYQIRGAEFRRLLDTDVKFNRLILQAVAANYMEVLTHFQQVSEESAGIRFCRLLLESYVEKNGRKILPKTMTFLELSKYLGTHPVTVSRIVASLRKSGCIAKEQGTVVIIDEDRLWQLINEGAEIK